MVAVSVAHSLSQPSFYFGLFCLHGDGLLQKQGQSIALSPKQQALLRVLVEARGQVVTKDDILQRVWQDEDVNDSSLTRCIHDLRQRLNDASPGSNSYIETLYGRGYRLNAQVRVVNSPPLTPGTQPNPRLRQAAETEPRVYEAYLEARYLFRQRNAIRLQQAIRLYQQALTWDPGYAPAYVGLADCYACLVSWSALPLLQAKPLIATALAQAAALDPQTPGLAVMQAAMISALDWQFTQAEALFRLALGNQPNDPESLLFYARHLIASGKVMAALEVMETVVDLDPLSPLTHGFYSFTLHLAGQGAASLAAVHRALELDSQAVAALGYLCLIAATQGDWVTALAAGEKARELAPGLPLVQAVYAYSCARAGELAEVVPIIQRAMAPADLPARSFVAPVAAALGDGDATAAILQQSWRDRCLWLPVICHDPRLDPVRNHPAVKRWLSRV
jgi:DNA-binding winged helix-turn-helix (wHTH) protein